MDPATGMETCKTRQKKYIWFHQKLGFWEGSIVSPGLGGLPSKMVRVKGFLLYMDIVVSPGLPNRLVKSKNCKIVKVKLLVKKLRFSLLLYLDLRGCVITNIYVVLWR